MITSRFAKGPVLSAVGCVARNFRLFINRVVLLVVAVRASAQLHRQVGQQSSRATRVDELVVHLVYLELQGDLRPDENRLELDRAADIHALVDQRLKVVVRVVRRVGERRDAALTVLSHDELWIQDRSGAGLDDALDLLVVHGIELLQVAQRDLVVAKLAEVLVQRLAAQVGLARLDDLIEKFDKARLFGGRPGLAEQAEWNGVVLDVGQVLVHLFANVGLRRHPETVHARCCDVNRRELLAVLHGADRDSEGVWAATVDRLLERQRGRREISWVEELGHRICILGDSHLNHFRSGKLRHENQTMQTRTRHVI